MVKQVHKTFFGLHYSKTESFWRKFSISLIQKFVHSQITCFLKLSSKSKWTSVVSHFDVILNYMNCNNFLDDHNLNGLDHKI